VTTTSRPADPSGEDGVLAGRTVVDDPTSPVKEPGTPGIRVLVFTSVGAFVAEAVTAHDGRWTIAGLRAGQYLVVAEVPSAYAPRHGLDPWDGGAVWRMLLGIVEIDDRAVDLVDLVLTLR